MREYRLLNNNWKFTYGDKVGASPDEINRWQDIGLPHSFGIPYFDGKKNFIWDMEPIPNGLSYPKRIAKNASF